MVESGQATERLRKLREEVREKQKQVSVASEAIDELAQQLRILVAEIFGPDSPEVKELDAGARTKGQLEELEKRAKRIPLTLRDENVTRLDRAPGYDRANEQRKRLHRLEEEITALLLRDRLG